MNALQLLDHLRGRGVRLEAHDDKLKFDAPAGVLTADLKQTMASQKATLLRLLEIEAARDRAAAALRDLEVEAERVQHNDEAYADVLRRWCSTKHAYETLAKAVPEPQATTCYDCGRPSPRGLTPCDVCLADLDWAAKRQIRQERAS